MTRIEDRARPPQVAGLVLAGGLSRRMDGREKSLMDLNGKPLLHHVLDRLSPQVGSIAINANGDPDRFSQFSCPVIADREPGHAGPLAGIHAGMVWAQSKGTISHIASAAADTPFLPKNLVEKFVEHVTDKDPDTIVLASTKGRLHPVFGLWPVHLAGALEEFFAQSETRKVLAFTDRHPMVSVDFESETSGLDPFFNINTPQELETVIHHLKELNQ